MKDTKEIYLKAVNAIDSLYRVIVMSNTLSLPANVASVNNYERDYNKAGKAINELKKQLDTYMDIANRAMAVCHAANKMGMSPDHVVEYVGNMVKFETTDKTVTFQYEDYEQTRKTYKIKNHDMDIENRHIEYVDYVMECFGHLIE